MKKTVKQVLNVSRHSRENTFTRVSFLINIAAAFNLSWHTRKVGTGTQDPPSGTLHLRLRTWEPRWNTGHRMFTQDPGSETLHLGPGILNLGTGTQYLYVKCGTPYLGTFTLIQLSLNVLVAYPSCFKQIASQICTT